MMKQTLSTHDGAATRVRPTMRDVAQHAGVSLKTVSRVVNDEPSVDKVTRARVQTAITTLGFRPNALASGLRRGYSSAMIGLVIEEISNPFFSAIAHGVEEIARNQHYMVVIGSNEKVPEREREVIGALLRRHVEGLLIVPASNDQTYLLPEIEHGTPAVFLDRPPANIAADAVLLDNRGGTRRAIEHLLAQHHRRIAFIGGNQRIYTGAERLAGYKDALHAVGFSEDPNLLRFARHDVIQAEAATYELLDLPDPPTAIFADNNRMSVGVIRALRARSVQVALVSFDDIELADMLSMPIAVVTHDATEMGHQAVQLLLARLRGDDSPPKRIIIPTQLVIRGA